MRYAPALLVAFLAAGAVLAQQQQAPTPIPQNVVVPSLPDEKNKEGVVQPTGAMQSDPAGYVRNDATAVDPNAPAPAGAPATGRPAPGPGIVAPVPLATPAGEPQGKAVVRAAYLTVRGVVKGYEKGVSITVVEANGKERSVPLAEKAAVYEGVAAGDKVIVRVPLQQPADGKHADRVEKQKPPKAPLRSKFSEAQSPRS